MLHGYIVNNETVKQFNDLEYYVAFSHCYGIGPITFKLLLNHFSSPKYAYQADLNDLKPVLGENLALDFEAFRNEFDRSAKMEDLRKKSIAILTPNNASFPSKLKNLSDCPICLYVRGDLTTLDFENNLFIAVVGTRKPSAYGEQITKKFTADLVSSGFIIVSGLALGIDTIAHTTALDYGGKTVAVLGCGVDIVYPPSNRALYEKIIGGGGLIISEFPPGQLVRSGLFVARNRLVSGLSQGVLVIEGAADSGALITAKYAAIQGREVFAPPAPITSPMSAAPNILLKQGAKLVTATSDILEEFNLRITPRASEKLQVDLTTDEQIIFKLLVNDAKQIDEIVQDIKITIHEVLRILSTLEIKGVIEKNFEGKYQIKI